MTMDVHMQAAGKHSSHMQAAGKHSSEITHPSSLRKEGGGIWRGGRGRRRRGIKDEVRDAFAADLLNIYLPLIY